MFYAELHNRTGALQNSKRSPSSRCQNRCTSEQLFSSDPMSSLKDVLTGTYCQAFTILNL
jgi:hypothetical protein